MDKLESVVARLEAVAAKLEGGAGAAPAGAAVAESGSAAIGDYDALVAAQIPALQAAADKIDADTAKIVGMYAQAIAAQRAMLNIAAQSKKPADVQPFLKPTADLMGEINSFRDANRPSKFFNNLSAISESCSALGWVAVSPTPGPFVDDARASAEFYTNKLLREFRGKDENQVAFVKATIEFLKGLRAVIKSHYTTGLTWNPKGADAVAPSAAPAAGAPPPPPAGGMSEADIKAMGGSGGKTAEQSAKEREIMLKELAEIRERQEKTGSSGLRKVTKDMKSKAQGKVSGVVKAAPKKAPVSKTRVNKPAVKELQGNKWMVEYQYDNKQCEITDTEVRQVAYIYKCENSVIQIKGKINAVTMDGCKKVGLVFDSAVATCEIINCTSVQVQCTGKTPSVSIDNTNGCQLFLSREGIETEVITSKSSELNINVPGKTDNDDPLELPVPEQFVTRIVDGKLVTETVAHEG